MRGAIAFLKRSTGGIPAPAEWMMEVTNRCNLACPMCLRDKAIFTQRDMDDDFINRLLDTNSSPKAIWLYGYGEPLMQPNLFRTIRRVKEKGIVTCISTNGTLLNESVARRLIDSGLDYLIIAVDGA